MNFINLRTAILCCAYCLCACSMSVNAQDVVVDISSNNALDTTGNLLNAFENNPELFSITPNGDGLTNSNELIEPITVAVVEAGDTGLELTIENAVGTSGIDGFGGENRAQFVVSGLGIGLRSTNLRIDPAIPAFDLGLTQSIFRLDGAYEEFLTFSFNQNITVTGIGITGLDPEDTFQFGAAENITDLSDMTLDDLTMGTYVEDAIDGNVDEFTFETPLVIPAGEEILIGQTGFNASNLSGANAGVGIERILLTLGGATPLLGDVNLDGTVDFLDISPFIVLLSTNTFQLEADIDGSGAVDFLDISPFIVLLSAT